MKIKNLKELAFVTGLSQQEIADMMGWGKTMASLISTGKYKDWEELTEQAVKQCISSGKLVVSGDEIHEAHTPQTNVNQITIDHNAFIVTPNVQRITDLANDLLDNDSTLNASIGLVTGRAGYGKTTALRRFIVNHDDAIYVLWMNYTRPQLFAKIAEELTGKAQISYYKNINLIKEVTTICRKLIIIDEADRMPLQILEDMRTLNEDGTVPLLLVGEQPLVEKAYKLDRIKSRIRKPEIVFKALDWIELAAFYEAATGLKIEKDVAQKLVADAHRDFRIAANDMQQIVKTMNANGATILDMEVLNAIRRAR